MFEDFSVASNLINASAEISNGNFSPDIGTISKGDIGQLQKKFLIMAGALKEREERHKAESETRLIQSEKQASVGKLAAGVAHEINNPLTAVLTFSSASGASRTA
jgi:two-component system NtrC family sensor kinase